MDGFLCQICGKVFSRMIRLNEHILKVHQRQYICHICNSQFEDRPTFKSHNCNIQCSYCDKRFQTNFNKRQHEKSVHLNVKISCSKCDKMLSGSVYHRKRHESKCLGETSYSCSFCGDLFNTLRQLNFHLKMKHDIKPPRPSKSSISAQNTAQAATPTNPQNSGASSTVVPQASHNHQAPQAEENRVRYRCRLCPLGFENMSLLQNHYVREHRGRGLQPMPYLAGQEPWLLDRNEIDHGLRECYEDNRALILELPNRGPVESIYNIPVAENLNYEEIERGINEIYDRHTHAFRINLSFGFIMRHDTERRYRYFRPQDNVSVLDQPVLISKRSDIQKVMRQLRAMDIIFELSKNRPDTKWRLVLISNIRFKVYSTNFALGSDRIILPDRIKNSKSIISLHIDPVTKTVFRDHLCAFRCLCLYLHGATDKQRVMSLYEAWRDFETIQLKRGDTCADPSLFDGLQLKDLPSFEQCFQVNVNVFEMNENREACPLFKSSERYPKTMYVNHFNNHLSYIQDFENYAKKYQCKFCQRLFKTYSTLKQHSSKCKDKTRFVFPGGFYQQPKTIFEQLENIGIHVPEKDRYYPWFAVFDCESLLQKIENDRTQKVEWTHQHIPVSVSICSNVPAHTQPVCFVHSNLESLVDSMISQLENIMATSRDLAKQKWGWVLDAISQKMSKSDKHQAGGKAEDYDVSDNEQEDDDDDEQDRSLDDTIPDRKLKKLYGSMQGYIDSLVVLGFNSSKYDINLIKHKLVARLDMHLESKNSSTSYTIKKGNAYACISTSKFKFLDITHFLAPGSSYASFFKAYQIAEEKGFFPYEWFDDISKLKQTYLPEKEAFFSSLQNESITEENYQHCQQVWQNLNMQTFEDFLIWYNNLDVKPFVKAASKLQQFYFDKGIDVFKTTISVPGIARKMLFDSAK